MRSRVCLVLGWLAVALTMAEVAVVMGSWIVSSFMSEGHVRSLITDDGLRWLVGSMSRDVPSEVMVWMVFVGATSGLIHKSRLAWALTHTSRLRQLERQALRIVLCEVVAISIALCWLTLPTHAVLLSAVGSLGGSSVAHGLVPLLCAIGSLLALTYGTLTGSFGSMASASEAVVRALAWTSPFLLLYIMASGVWRSVMWVLAI